MVEIFGPLHSHAVVGREDNLRCQSTNRPCNRYADDFIQLLQHFVSGKNQNGTAFMARGRYSSGFRRGSPHILPPLGVPDERFLGAREFVLSSGQTIVRIRFVGMSGLDQAKQSNTLLRCQASYEWKNVVGCERFRHEDILTGALRRGSNGDCGRRQQAEFLTLDEKFLA